MLRPQQTAETILNFHQNLQLILKQDLVEIGHGLWEGKLENEIKGKWPELLKSWHDNPEKVKMPEGESIKEVSDRDHRKLQKISHKSPPPPTAVSPVGL